MKRFVLVLAVSFGMLFMLTACGGNEGTVPLDNKDDVQVENPTDSQKENATGEEALAEEETLIEEETLTEEETVEADAEKRVEKEIAEKGEQTEMKMNVQVGDYNFTAELENNPAVEELIDMMKQGPVTIQMDDYSGFEKVGSLGRSLTTTNSQTTTSAGDIVLYNGDNIVMFYGSNSWSYTRIGKIKDLSNWEKALGSGSITAVFTLDD